MKTQTKILWLLIVLITFFALSAKAQHVGIENAMLDIPDGYYLSQSDTVKCIMIVSSDTWQDQKDNFKNGYVVTQKHRFKRVRNRNYVMYFNRVLLHKLIFLDAEKKELKNQIVWDYRIVKEQSDLEKTMSAEPLSIIGRPINKTIVQVPTEPNNFGGIEIPIVRDYQTVEYDSSQYVRISEFQELKQKLHDQKEAYKREAMIHILARFCTFMSPERAAIEAVKYSEALIKELENEKQ